MSVSCPACDVEHEDGTRFCPQCGKGLVDGAKQQETAALNAHLYGMHAGEASAPGRSGQSRRGAEPRYRDTGNVVERITPWVYKQFGVKED